MKRILLLAVLLCACATETSVDAESGAAGSVGVASEPILAGCSFSSVCNAQKAFVDSASGTHWTWSSSTCSTSAPPWHGSAPGGRLAYSVLTPANNVYHRQFELSQQWTAVVHCTCAATEAPKCSF